MKHIKIVLLLVASITLLFNSCVTYSRELLIYKGNVDLDLGDYCNMGGRVIDKNTQKPLIGATIIITGTTRGAATDLSGSYFINNITPGVYDISVAFVGYEVLRISKFEFEKNNYYLVDFELLFQD